ncbi:MAG: AarF/UbiB family protein [Coriobacteriales bacterium]|nr:AarF/UbiB family protein [Coriobacteriales bacterium]
MTTREELKELREERKEKLKKRGRSSEILAVFARHSFYVNGLTPEELRTTLEDLGPTYVKIGQIMSSRTDILPESYCRELEMLRSNVVPLEADVVRSIIEEETGKAIDEIYSEFEDKPLGSASMAQAHFGVLLDGTEVVTKVQRPHIAEMMRDDFVMLKKLAKVIGIVGEADGPGSIDLVSVVRELEKVTEEELDFRVEAEHTRKFRELCIEDDSVVSCPTIVDELTTVRMLTMTCVDGYSIAERDRIEADGYDRKQIGEAIIGNYLHQVLDVGMFHGDPHQGNIMLSQGVPYWIDFGMIGHISESSINVLQQMVFSLVQKDSEELTEAALTLGIAHGKVDKARLTDDVDGLVARVANAKNLSEIDMGALLTQLTDLLSVHNISMPSEYTMLARSIVTMEGVIEELCPELALFDFLSIKMVERAKESFDAKAGIMSLMEDMMQAGKNAYRVPALTYEVLRNLVKGRTKVAVELSGYDEIVDTVSGLVTNVVLATFACVLFFGSCILCTTDVKPESYGIPLIAAIGFLVSIALAIFTLRRLTRGHRA